MGRREGSWHKSGSEMGVQGSTPGEQAGWGAGRGWGQKANLRALQLSRGHPFPLAFWGRGQCVYLRG